MCNAQRQMRLLITLYTILILIFAWTPVSAHKDRIEKPRTYRLTFLDGQEITIDSNNSTLTTYCKDIVDGQRKLIKAQLIFSTGETITFEGNGDNWTKIKIADGKKEINIPELTLMKIPVIHFQTIALLWDGRDAKAFKASYFYIRFDIGNEKSFNEYPELHLSFSGNEFVKSEVWLQTSENSKQRGDL